VFQLSFNLHFAIIVVADHSSARRILETLIPEIEFPLDAYFLSKIKISANVNFLDNF